MPTKAEPHTKCLPQPGDLFVIKEDLGDIRRVGRAQEDKQTHLSLWNFQNTSENTYMTSLGGKSCES